MSSLFEIKELTKSYGERLILDRLSFEIERGECLVILGRSGSGKSVTLRQLNGLERPDSGSVLFDGVDITDLEEKDLYGVRRRVAMLFQSGALFDSMSVLDNIAYPVREHTDLDEHEVVEIVEQKLRLVDLEGVLDRMPADLSGGMRKRVALARSLALDPEVVLFDEPTTGLDPTTSATIARLIKSTQLELGVTCVVVTHDLSLARTTATKLAFLDSGRFRFWGTWSEADASDDTLLQDFLHGREHHDGNE